MTTKDRLLEIELLLTHPNLWWADKKRLCQEKQAILVSEEKMLFA
jgi:hypothetical protein